MLIRWSKVSKPLHRQKHPVSWVLSSAHTSPPPSCLPKSLIPEDLWCVSLCPRAHTRDKLHKPSAPCTMAGGRPQDQIVPKAKVQLCHRCVLSTPPSCSPAPCHCWGWTGTVGWCHTPTPWRAQVQLLPSWWAVCPWEGTSLPGPGSASLYCSLSA